MQHSLLSLTNPQEMKTAASVRLSASPPCISACSHTNSDHCLRWCVFRETLIHGGGLVLWQCHVVFYNIWAPCRLPQLDHNLNLASNMDQLRRKCMCLQHNYPSVLLSACLSSFKAVILLTALSVLLSNRSPKEDVMSSRFLKCHLVIFSFTPLFSLCFPILWLYIFFFFFCNCNFKY